MRVWLAGVGVSGLLLGLSGPIPARAADLSRVREIPTEYETTSGVGVALNNGGYALNDAHSAIRANPALMAVDRSYSVTGGYHWPRSGREFYQASVVDSKTSSIAAGVSYTGYTDDYLYPRGGPEDAGLDSPIIRRGVVGAAGMMGRMALGIGATYVESHPLEGSMELERGEDRVRGFGLNAGVATALTPQFRFGASAENLTNRRIRDYVPRTFRAGLAYIFSPDLTAYLDFRQRDRVIEFEGPVLDYNSLPATEPDLQDKPEQLAIASFIGRFAENVAVMGSYAHAMSDERRSVAGGILIGTPKMHLSYTVSRPYMKRAGENQAAGVGFEMSM